MSTTSVSTRRSFIRTAGAALSVPLAAAAVQTPVPAEGAAEDGEPPDGRLARLEDVQAIRALTQAYARHVNVGDAAGVAALFADSANAAVDAEVRGITPVGFDAQDTIGIAADGLSATAVLPCLVQRERAIGPSCPLVEMAREQGGGVVRHTERGEFELVSVKRHGTWRIERATYRVA